MSPTTTSWVVGIGHPPRCCRSPIRPSALRTALPKHSPGRTRFTYTTTLATCPPPPPPPPHRRRQARLRALARHGHVRDLLASTPIRFWPACSASTLVCPIWSPFSLAGLNTYPLLACLLCVDARVSNMEPVLACWPQHLPAFGLLALRRRSCVQHGARSHLPTALEALTLSDVVTHNLTVIFNLLGPKDLSASSRRRPGRCG